MARDCATRYMKPANSQELPAHMLLVKDLKSRGWTNQLIARFLIKPDWTTAPSGKGSGRPASLYALDRVVQVERSVEFYRSKQKSRQRAVQVKAALTKRQDATLLLCENIPLLTPTMPLSDLLEQASRELSNTQGAPSSVDDPKVRERAVDIMLRSFTEADSRLDVFGWTTGVRRARTRLAQRKLDLIASHYPVLSKTCRAHTLAKVFTDEKAAA